MRFALTLTLLLALPCLAAPPLEPDVVELQLGAGDTVTLRRQHIELLPASVPHVQPAVVGDVDLPGVVTLAQGEPLPAPAPASTADAVLRMVLEYLVAPLLPVIGGLLAWALKKLVDYLNTKSAESAGALVASKLAGAAASAVAEINVTLRPKLQAALADGVLTDAEKKELKDAALELLKTKLPKELLGAASGIFGGFLDTYLGGLVERSLLDQKATAAIAARPS